MLTKEQEYSIKELQAHILQTAGSIVKSDRNVAYGEPEDNFQRIALFWQAYFESTGRPEAKVTATDISALMRLMKEARLCHTPDHLDSFIDLVGYTLTGLRVVETQRAADIAASQLEEKSLHPSVPVLSTLTSPSEPFPKQSKMEEQPMTDTSHAALSAQLEAANARAARARDDALVAERDTAWNDAIEAAADYLEPKNDRYDWTQYAYDRHHHATAIRHLKKGEPT